jgi:hypothetical protein
VNASESAHCDFPNLSDDDPGSRPVNVNATKKLHGRHKTAFPSACACILT